MYAKKPDMKIYAAAMDAGATSTNTTIGNRTQPPQSQQQQREYRQRFINGGASTTTVQHKQAQTAAKYNKSNCKTGNTMRQAAKFNQTNANGNGTSNSLINASASDTKQNKRQAQQQQQQQQSQQQSLGRKKYFGSTTNITASTQTYYFQQQAPQPEPAAAGSEMSINNNNSASMKNQNMLLLHTVVGSKANDGNNNYSLAAINPNALGKLQLKCKKYNQTNCEGSASTCSSSSSSSSSGTASVTSSTERIAAEKQLQPANARVGSNKRSWPADTTLERNVLGAHVSEAKVDNLMAFANDIAAEGDKPTNQKDPKQPESLFTDEPAVDLTNTTSSLKQLSKHKSKTASQWKFHLSNIFVTQQALPQASAVELIVKSRPSEKLLFGTEETCARSIDEGVIPSALPNKPSASPSQNLEERFDQVSSYKQHIKEEHQLEQQPPVEQQRSSNSNYAYQSCYPQPKQLTIASFLHKDMLPEDDGIQQGGQQPRTSYHHGSHQHGHGPRYRNTSAYNQSQSYQTHLNVTSTQPSFAANYAGGRRRHNNNAGPNRRALANMVGTSGPVSPIPQQQTELLPRNSYNGGQGRMRHAGLSIANITAVAGSGVSGGGNKNFYSHGHHHQQHQHHSHHHGHHNQHHHFGSHQALMAGSASSTPTTPQPQNLLNLTYVNMSHAPSTAIGTASTITTASARGQTQRRAPLMLTSAMPMQNANSTVPRMLLPPADMLQTPVTELTTSPAAAGSSVGGNVYMAQPTALHGIMSPVSLAPETAVVVAGAPSTPTNMISCSQLDEAIKAAAVNGSGNNRELPTPTAVMAIPSPTYASVPYILQPRQQQHQQTHQQQGILTTQSMQVVRTTLGQGPPHLVPSGAIAVAHQAQQVQQQPLAQQPAQPQMFFSYADNPQGSSGSWSSSSPSYNVVYGGGGPSPSPLPAQIEMYPVMSPASSTSSIGNDPYWYLLNRQKHQRQYLDLISPIHNCVNSETVGAQRKFHIPTAPPLPPFGNFNGEEVQCTCQHLSINNGTNISATASKPSAISSLAPSGDGLHADWCELVLPPDRFVKQARNVELTTAPEQLVCFNKYDNLSKEIWTRFTSAQQSDYTFRLKMRLWRYLFMWLSWYLQQPVFNHYRICLVGSTITGFGTDSSDIDMCLLPEKDDTQRINPHNYNEQRSEALLVLSIFNDLLKEAVHSVSNQNYSAIFKDFNLIEARVPILRFRDRANNLEVDLNYNNCVGIKNTYLLQMYAQMDWRPRPLAVVVKLWAQYHDINDAKRMTISSYSLVLMVIHYLQFGCTPAVLPCLHSLYPGKFDLDHDDCVNLDLVEAIDTYPTANVQSLGELLLGFFKYYSNFDFRNNAISIRTGGILPVSVCRLARSYKNDVHQWKELNIEEPFDYSNTARSVYDYPTFERVKAVFVASAQRLEQTLDLNSVFMPVQCMQRALSQEPQNYQYQQVNVHQQHYQPNYQENQLRPGNYQHQPPQHSYQQQHHSHQQQQQQQQQHHHYNNNNHVHVRLNSETQTKASNSNSFNSTMGASQFP